MKNFEIRHFVSFVFVTTLAIAWLVSQPVANAQEGDICVDAKIKLKQEGTPEGRGFEGTLVLSNGLGHFEAGDLEFQESFTFDGASNDGAINIQGTGTGQFQFRLKRRRNPKRLVNGRARIDFMASIDGASQENVDGRGRLRLRGRISANNETCVKGKLKLRGE